MPVVIKDFSVETNGQNEPEPAAPPDASQTPVRPQTGRQVAQLMKALRQRACRLHAD